MSAEAAAPHRSAVASASGLITAGRIAAAELLWGEGFVHPGGAAESVRLVAKLGLAQASTLLLLGAGPGGAALAIARERRCAVRGFEADPELVSLAASREAGSSAHGQVQTRLWDVASPGFPAGDCRYALALRPLREAPAAIVLASLADAMRPGGQLVMVDVVADRPPDPADPGIAAWARLDPRRSTLPLPAEVEQAMAQAGFDVHGSVDITEHETQLAEAGWRAALAVMQTRRPDPSQARAIAAESELWRLRLGLLRARRLRVVQWYAIRTI